MSSKKSHSDWNELEYISWNEFRKMAPSIIKLEISRIDSLLKEVQSETEIYNSLIKARYELNQFVACLERTKSPPLPASCRNHLSNAILNLSFGDKGNLSSTNAYILDRLNYVHTRIGMIY